MRRRTPLAAGALVSMFTRLPFDHRLPSAPALCRVLLLAVAALLVVPQAAGAHSAGRPPHATLAADGRVVTIDWMAMGDDAAAVGVAVGLLPEKAIDAFLGLGPWEDMPSDDDIRMLSRSDELRQYLLENTQVFQDGRACSGDVEPAADFIAKGARFTFTCPRPVDFVDLRITILHDRDPLYRTFGVDGTYQTTVHTSAQPTHTWDFTGASALPPGFDWETDVRRAARAGAVTVLGVLLGVEWRRRRRELATGGDAMEVSP
jgi:hypothetical protein